MGQLTTLKGPVPRPFLLGPSRVVEGLNYSISTLRPLWLRRPQVLSWTPLSTYLSLLGPLGASQEEFISRLMTSRGYTLFR